MPDGFALDPAQVRALFAAVCDWQARVGGRDAAIAFLAEKAHGHHEGLTAKTYDAVYALYQFGADSGCGLIDDVLYDTP